MRDLKKSFRRRVPLWFKVADDSNNIKIWDVIQPELDLLLKTINDIEKIIDIDQTTDIFVDKHGKNMGERRRGDDDLAYIKRIKGKISKLKAKSDHNSVARAMSGVLGIDIGKIELHSTENRHLRADITVPLLTDGQAGETIMSAKASGIIVDAARFKFTSNSSIGVNKNLGFTGKQTVNLLYTPGNFLIKNDEYGLFRTAFTYSSKNKFIKIVPNSIYRIIDNQGNLSFERINGKGIPENGILKKVRGRLDFINPVSFPQTIEIIK